MKKIIKLILFLLLTIILIIFYTVYFGGNKNIKIDTSEEQSITVPKDNLIKNLKYEVNLDKKNKYVITSNLSKITYENSVEVVKMQKVVAIFTDQENIPLIIKCH